MRESTKKLMLLLPVAAVVLGVVAFTLFSGDDDHKSSSGPEASRTQASPPGDGRADGSGQGAGGSGGAQPDGSGAAGEGKSSTGGAGAPRAGKAVDKRTLQRYLAKNFRHTPWYPLLRKLRISGSRVWVYLDFSPENDDETPPSLACTQVLSYGRPVKRVTVYGAPTTLGKLTVMRDC